MKIRLLLPFVACATLAFAENEIGFIEKFALAKDRATVLTQLVPGTEEFYFFHALHFQNTKDAAKLKDIMEQWAKRFPQSGQRQIIENRAALLAYDADPQATLKFLRDRLQLQFNHTQEVRGQKPDLPVVLDPAKISRAAFLAEALKDDDLGKLSIAALESLVRDKVALREPQRRVLLGKLNRPDLPGLMEVIVADLKSKESKGFGEFAIHRALLPEQLDELAKAILALAENEPFVLARLAKLAPSADADPEYDPAERDALLTRLWDYAKTLSPAFNTLKAGILRQRLEFDRQRGIYNKALFLEYLKLPRNAGYVNPKYLQDGNLARNMVDMNRQIEGLVLPMPPIANDEPLVRDYFLHLLINEESYEAYTSFIRDTWLKPVFAEAKIVNGIGDPEKWASLLSPSVFAALKDRVDVEFSLANKKQHAPADEVSIDVFVKNAPKVIVKIYEINTLSYFLTQRRQLNTDLNLDGLVANVERTEDFAADAAAKSPFRRVLRTFKFPELKGRGAWVVEFIGSGKSSRALIRKGQWSVISQAGPAGDLLSVLDEAKKPVADAAIWVDGRKFTRDEKSGVLLVPFTQQPGRKPVVLADAAGTFATLTDFEHHGENYTLDAQFHIEREQLLAGKDATLAVRAGLLVNAAQVSLDLLQDTQLTITSILHGGVKTTTEVKGLKFDAAKVLTHTIKVPERLNGLSITLTGKVDVLTKGGEKQELSAEASWNVNGIDLTPQTDDGHLSKFGENHVYELLGKNGEPSPDKQVVFHFYRRGIAQVIEVPLRTDEKGRAMLGDLDGIERLSARVEGRETNRWTLTDMARTWPAVIHAQSGGKIEIPWARDFAPDSYSLLEVRGGTFVANRTKNIMIPPLGPYIEGKDGKPKPGLKLPFITIENLPAGDYSLRLRDETEREIRIRVTDGAPVQGWLLGPNRELELRESAPLHIANVKVGQDAIEVVLANAGKYARVHVAASRFLPEFPFAELAGFKRFGPAAAAPERLPSLFSAGRDIGDEFRYILDRRFAQKFAGNMLTRPGLLLNPWEKRSTDLDAQSQQGKQAAPATAGGRNRAAALGEEAKAEGLKRTNGAVQTNNVDFLATAAPALFNLTPDAQGIVRIDRKLLGDRQYIQVYAEDLANAAWRAFAVDEVPTKFQDDRLTRNLDPAKPFAEKKKVTVLAAGQILTLADILTSELETYDTLAGVHMLFTTLSHDAKLAQFAWVLEWPKLKDTEKRTKYSEFACHELNFFLAKKDPQFFAAVVKPYLANKKDKTFLDDWLLDADLARHLEPWAYARLNVVERALLGQRLPAEAANAARHLRELWELLPPNPTEQDRLFETALRGRALGGEGGGSALGLEKNKLSEQLIEDKPAAPAAPPPMPANPAKPVAAAKELKDVAAFKKRNEDEVRMQLRGLAADEKKDADKLAVIRDGAEVELGRRKAGVPTERFARDFDTNGAANALFGAVEARELRGLGYQAAYYRKLGPTKEWAENNYYKLPIEEQDADLVTINAFWRDFAVWIAAGAKAPFLSEHVAEAHRNFTEMMLALAVLDLPFDAPKHTMAGNGISFTLTAGGPVIAFHKEIKPAAPAKEATELLVSQNFYRHGDRYRQEGNEKFDKYVTDEFLSGVVYGANIVVTNPTSSPQKLELLLQIPRGALPVAGSKATDSRSVRLEPYTTQQFEYFFYFPASAAAPFPHYPVNVAKAEAIVGAAKPFTFKVVKQLSQIDKASWDYVSQYGTDADVFAFLDQNNIARLDLERVAWRARKSVDFFRKLVAALEKDHVWSEPIYRYAFQHNELAPLREWLRHRDDFLAQCGPSLDAKPVRIDPIERRAYEHLEYSPLVNQRSLRLGAENRIANPVLRGQYQHLLTILAHRPALDPMDEMSVVYYLFLQDRTEEALARFATIKPEALPTKLQHDYFRCYAAFYEEKLADARKIAAQYADHSVDRWRALFAEVGAQLDEIEGKDAKREDDKPDREKQQAELATAQPTFDIKVENRTLALTWKNLPEVTVNYYLMDPEFLFSANPFVSEDSSRFSFIKPTQTAVQKLPAGKDTLDVPLPAEFAKANVLVEVLGAGQRKAQAYHAHTFKLTVSENYGRLEVREGAANKPVSKAYVKVYARLQNGEIRYFKDGYTDLRGKFDYVSLNSSDAPPQPIPVSAPRGGANAENLGYQMLRPNELGAVEKFAILVLSEAHGAIVKEVNRPTE